MRSFLIALAASSILAGAAQAADKPVIGPAPVWVKPVAVPRPPAKPDDAPLRVLLSDQQVALEPGRQTLYSEVALTIQTPQGLAAGNISFPWRPDTDVLTVHKLLIRRGDTTIDVLKSGQTFTVLRRETNLESATLDGVLTANIQPEGLQVGDTIEFAASIASSDPVLKGHAELLAGGWGFPPMARAHLRVQWPATMPVRLRQTPGLPVVKPVAANGLKTAEFSLENVQPLVPPKGAPARYALGRLMELSDFASWADLGALMAPLYTQAAVIPAQGPLRVELDRIRAASTDPRQRAQAALALVQDRVRYVALAMGAGGLVPTGAETTWSRRYGDCKGKTALLLALLHALDIQAEPVGVHTSLGDGLDARLPMVGLFNHVLVRATVAGKTYWLDGTRTGDALDRLTVPGFGWGLPFVPANAALVRMVPAPLERPASEVAIRIDATAGLTPPAPVTVETVLRGDDAIGVSRSLANLQGDARDRALRDYWKSEYDFIDVTAATARFDAATGEQHLSMTGMARMDWSSDQYETDGTGVGYKADFSRDPGPARDAPFAVAFPTFNRTTETILLPPGFIGARAGTRSDVDETVAGIAYRRRATLVGNTFTVERTERSVAPEFAAKDAPAAEKRLRELAELRVYLAKPAGYVMTAKEVAGMLTTTPKTTAEFMERGRVLLDLGQFPDAFKAYDQAVRLDPKSAWALAARGLTHVWMGAYAAATTDLDASAAIDPRTAVLFRARGLLAQRNGEPKDAVAAYTAALALEPNDDFALTHRAEAARAVGDNDAALRDSAAVLQSRPRRPDLYLMRASIFRGQGKAEAGLAEAAALAAAAPDDAYAQVVAGRIYSTFGKSADAMRQFDRALAIKPEAYVYLNRAESRLPSDMAGRESDIAAALRLEPGSEDAIAAQGRLQTDRGQYAAAAATYTTALAKASEPRNLRVLRGLAYARAGNTALADKDFDAAAAGVDAPGTFNNLCWQKATAGVALERALGECDSALKLMPGNPAYLDSRALVLLRLGRVDAALSDYDRALAKSADLASSLYGRALAWARKGDKAKAEADAAAAMRVDASVRERFAGFGLTL